MGSIKSSTNFLYHGIFWLLGILSVLYFKERLFVDSSYYIFKSLNQGWFHIEHGRGILALSQLLPLIGKLFGLPLKALLILYSVGQVLFFYLLFCLFQHHFKMPVASISIVGIMVLAQSWLYFIPMLEIVWGAALAILVISILRSDRWKDDKWLIILLLAFWLVLTSHPLNYLLALAIILFDLLDRGLIKKIHYSMIAFFLIAMIIEWLGGDAYELDKVVGIADSGLSNLKDTASLKRSFILILKKFWHVLLMGIASSVYFLIKKRWVPALIWPLAAGSILLAAFYRWDVSTDHWYTEVVFQPLVSIGIMLFSFAFIDQLTDKKQHFWQFAFGLLFLVYAISIVFQAEPMIKRTDQLESIIEQAQHRGIQKGLIASENISRPYHHFEWSAPVEALLISALDGPNEAISLVSDLDMNYTEHRPLLNDSSFLFRRFERMEHDELDEDYFHFDKVHYQNLNTDRSAAAVRTMSNNLQIMPLGRDQILKIPASDTSWAEVQINNLSDQPLPSDLNTNLYLANHWYQADTLYRWDGPRTPIQMDVIDSIQQDIRLWASEKRGIYQVQFDLVKEGEYWMELPKKFTVQVY